MGFETFFGGQRLRRLKAGDPAPHGDATGPDGQTIRLESLWSEGPAVLVFLRHFG